jgi:hypothetical protein
MMSKKEQDIRDRLKDYENAINTGDIKKGRLLRGALTRMLRNPKNFAEAEEAVKAELQTSFTNLVASSKKARQPLNTQQFPAEPSSSSM